MESDVRRLYVRHWFEMALHVSVVLLVLAFSFPAHAIPAFARKYGTSCQTCHTVYPKLTPFGEAFRRNGYRFPGVDSDYWKQDTSATDASANGQWNTGDRDRGVVENIARHRALPESGNGASLMRADHHEVRLFLPGRGYSWEAGSYPTN